MEIPGGFPFLAVNYIFLWTMSNFVGLVVLDIPGI
jgi:hypothetical protein